VPAGLSEQQPVKFLVSTHPATTAYKTHRKCGVPAELLVAIPFPSSSAQTDSAESVSFHEIIWKYLSTLSLPVLLSPFGSPFNSGACRQFFFFRYFHLTVEVYLRPKEIIASKDFVDVFGHPLELFCFRMVTLTRYFCWIDNL
jgi:hypothetical protein